MKLLGDTRKRRQLGAGLPEYALLVAMLMLVAIPSTTKLRIGIQKVFCEYMIRKGGSPITEAQFSFYFDSETGSCAPAAGQVNQTGAYW